MPKKQKKPGKTAKERKIDMAEHDYKLKALGLQERAAKKILRVLLLLVPAALVILWFIQNWK